MAREVLLPIPTGYHFTRIGPFRGTVGGVTTSAFEEVSFNVPTASPPDENYGEGDTLIAVVGSYCTGGGAYVSRITHSANPSAFWVRDNMLQVSITGGSQSATVEIWRAQGVEKAGVINASLALVPNRGSSVTLVGTVADICGYNLLLGPFGKLLDGTASAYPPFRPPPNADSTFTGSTSTSKPGLELWVGGITHLGNDQQSVSTVPGVTNGFNLLDGATAFSEMSVGYLDKINVDYNGWHGPFPVASSGVHVNPNWYVGCIVTYSPLATYLP